MWIKLYNIPLEYWNEEGLSHIASAVGKPLYVDSFTASKQRITYARLCVELQADKEANESFDLSMKGIDDNEDEEVIEIAIEYQWKPRICIECKVFGHSNSNCAMGTTKKVWKQKTPLVKGKRMVIDPVIAE